MRIEVDQSGKIEQEKDKVIRGTGNTCIFFHNSYLSQYVLEGKHPSSYKDISSLVYKIFGKICKMKRIRVKAKPPFLCLKPGFDLALGKVLLTGVGTAPSSETDMYFRLFKPFAQK